MIKLSYITYRAALTVLLLLLLALAPAMAQIVVHQGETTNLEVVAVPGHTYEWELYSDGSVDFATVPGNCSSVSARFLEGNRGANVKVNWAELGTYFFKVTARDAIGCTMNLKIGIVKVIPPEVEAIISGATQTGSCQLVTLDGSKSIGEIIKYEWSLLDQGGSLTRRTGVNTEFTISPAYKGSLPADFRVRLQVTSKNGVTHSDTITIKVDRLPVADIQSSAEPEKDGSMVIDGSVSIGTSLGFKWSTSEGKIVGPDNQSAAKLFGAGMYRLEVTDAYGCTSAKDFKFPLEVYQIIANDDYARTSWSRDTTINVLANDFSNAGLVPGSVHVIHKPDRGNTRVNADGTITYIPTVRKPSRDQFVYEVCDQLNLCDSATVTIDIYDTDVTAPEGFSPNGDGINDHLVFNGLEHYPKTQLYIYTRSGQLVYQSLDYKNDWDGRFLTNAITNEKLVPTGVYYYVLKLGGTTRVIKGYVFIGY